MNTHQLKNDFLELNIVPQFGCHWSSLKFQHNNKWMDLLYPVPKVEELPKFSTRDGSYLLAPWSNRLEKAQFQFEGKTHNLNVNFPDGTAIHGDVWTRPWIVQNAEKDRFEAKLVSSDFSDFNYPFPLAFHLSLHLKDKELQIKLDMKNCGDQKAPVGLGFHPFWKRRLTPDGSDAVLTVPANQIYPTKEGLPLGKAIPVEPKVDLRGGRDLKDVSLDDCYTSLSDFKANLTYKDPGVQIDYTFDPIFSHMVVYSPRDPDGNPREFVAVEPVTNVNNGFNLLAQGWDSTGVKILNPGETWGGTFNICVNT